MHWLIKKNHSGANLTGLNKNVTFSIWNRVKYCALSWTVNRPLRAKEVVITQHKASSCIMMQVTRNGAVFKIKDRWAMFRQMYALEKAKDFAALKKTLERNKKIKILENVNLGRSKPTQISKAEVREETALNSPFRLTSEVPLCAALHLFYPSSLIRLGWPCDPRARVTCQLTVHSWAWGLMLCQYLS